VHATAVFLSFVEGEGAVADSVHEGSQAETPNTETHLDELPLAPKGQSERRLTMAVSFSVFVLGSAAAAASAWPNLNIIALPNFSNVLAELFPHEPASPSIPDPVLSGLNDIRSAQQQHAAVLHENGDVLQQNTTLLRQDTARLDFLRQSFAAQQTSLRGISNQLSSLVARVDAIQNAVTPLTTSSIPQAKAHAAVASRKRRSRLPRPLGPVSVGGAPLGPAPATVSSGAG
jgi:hypothetical protein